jgi:hypothetical protein
VAYHFYPPSTSLSLSLLGIFLRNWRTHTLLGFCCSQITKEIHTTTMDDDEYAKLIRRMNPPRFFSFSPYSFIVF